MQCQTARGVRCRAAGRASRAGDLRAVSAARVGKRRGGGAQGLLQPGVQLRGWEPAWTGSK